MKAVGIIAEYDPFHAGHAWQIAEARRRGAEAVAVCMSGDLVQRGGAAQLPPWVRAKAALRAGADLVIELPNPWACLSAEGFAAAGVALLSALPQLDTLVFGAEQPDTEKILAAAKLLLKPDYAQQLADSLKTGANFAAARAAAAAKLSPDAGWLLKKPNNNLGVEYCKAILQQKSGLVPFAIGRRGADHGQTTPGERGFASASFIREKWREAGVQHLEEYLPGEAFQLYKQEEQQALDRSAFDTAVLSRLRGMPPQQIAKTRGTGEGLEYLLANALRSACTLEEVYAGMKSKRYAHARLRRYVLDAALRYTDELPKTPPYLHVLAANETGLSLLKGALLPADTSLARLEKQSEAAQMAAKAHCAGADLAALCRKRPQPMGQSYTRPPVIEK